MSGVLTGLLSSYFIVDTFLVLAQAKLISCLVEVPRPCRSTVLQSCRNRRMVCTAAVFLETWWKLESQGMSGPQRVLEGANVHEGATRQMVTGQPCCAHLFETPR